MTKGLHPHYVAWTDAHIEALRAIYSTPVPMSEIMAKTGNHPIESVYKKAKELGLNRPAMPRTPEWGACSLLAMELGARPQGLDAGDMGIPDRNRASTYLCRLVRKGKLVRRTFGTKVRYFTTAELADAHVLATLPQYSFSNAKPKAKKSRAGWGPDDPMHITPKTKYTIAPPPPAMVFRTSTHAR